MSVNFYLDKRKDKHGDSAIRVSITICGVRFLTSTGYKVAPAKWNALKQQVKQGCSNSKGVTYNAINSMLSRLQSHFSLLENTWQVEGMLDKDVIAEKLRTECNNVLGRKTAQPPAVKPDFEASYKLFMSETSVRNSWTEATLQKFRALKNHLDNFKKPLDFSDFNEAGLIKFVAYLRDVCKMRNTTIRKQLGFLKWFLRWAAANGYNEERAFLNFTPRFKTAPKQVIFLSWQELMRVYQYVIPENGVTATLTNSVGKEYELEVRDSHALGKTRDIFCFCCFTSLRYSDAVNLKWSDIKGDCLYITTIKTADSLRIELNKYALSILDKYKGMQQPGDRVFPHLSNQRMNGYLKTLCELCEINQPVTQVYYRGSERHEETVPKYELIGTHAGRRTFICNALMLGISPQVVMKWTGHSDYKSMKPYIDVTDAAKADAMKLFDNL